MKNLVIIGNGTYAAMLNSYIQQTTFGCVHAFSVEKEYIKEECISQIPVVALDSLPTRYPPQHFSLIMGIGYMRMGDVRKRIFEQCIAKGYSFENYIHPTAIIAPDIQMGVGNNILERVIIEMGVSIGNANLVYCGSIIGHETHIGNYNTLSGEVALAGCAQVKNNCFLGLNSTVRDHVILQDYTLIGAAAYADKSTSVYDVVVPPKSQILYGKKSTDYL